MQAGDIARITQHVVRQIVEPQYRKQFLADERFPADGNEFALLLIGMKVKCLGEVAARQLSPSGINFVEADAFEILEMESGERGVAATSKLYKGYTFLMSRERQATHLEPSES